MNVCINGHFGYGRNYRERWHTGQPYISLFFHTSVLYFISVCFYGNNKILSIVCPLISLLRNTFVEVNERCFFFLRFPLDSIFL